MAYKVLIVDDSSFFQLRLKEIINEHAELEVVGVASNGREAIELTHKLKPNIISMDYEMPMLDGVSAVKIIMQECPTPIIMFSSMTFDGARITLDALEAGALDFMPKNFAEISRNADSLKRKIHEMLLTFAKKGLPTRGSAPSPAAAPASAPTRPAPAARPARPTAPARRDPSESPSAAYTSTRGKNLGSTVRLVVVGASTGGPIALSEVLSKIPGNFPVPIVVIQHMPPNFTKALAERLNTQCALRVQEAQNGDMLQKGNIFVAPGGMQLMFDGRARNILKIIPSDERINYKPSLDIAFGSAGNTFKNGVLGVVLTGMGADGCEGAKILKEKGSHLWAQDEASCVVYGMPKAVRDACLTDDVIKLSDMGDRITKAFL